MRKVRCGTDDYLPISDYGIIGDMHTVALVGRHGSVDFMCWPHFDSPSVFLSLLDHKKGGFFQIAPTAEVSNTQQLYLPETNILLTRFLLPDGMVELSDFMPLSEDGETAVRRLVRRVKVVRGRLPIRMICRPAFDYARRDHRVAQDEGVVFTAEDASLTLRLRSDLETVEVKDGAAVADFTLEGGETAAFVLEEVTERTASAAENLRSYVSTSFKTTSNFWRAWSRQSTYNGRWREMVNRSALTLKLLTSSRHGSIIAAPTFGLPEVIGGERNWDYRYTWIRDATFTLYAFLRLGYTAEAKAFMDWIRTSTAELSRPETLQPMYRLDGGTDMTERTLSHLSGYRNSQPVRIGNAAHTHYQSDIFGELIDTIYLYDKYGDPVSFRMWAQIRQLLDWVCENWKRPDTGIWEVRGQEDHFIYSRIMNWVALDRGVRLSRKRGMPGNISTWRAARNEIYKDVFTNFWDSEQGAFVQRKGNNILDASTLVMPLVRMISPTDARWLSTLDAIGKHLLADTLVFRYRLDQGASDGLSGEEGTFTMCSFWYIECLSRAGKLNKARFLFEKMMGYANHLGLYGEELGLDGMQLGNFPQAFTHIALISTAYELDRKLKDGP